eukprot:272769-Chlamydomonas_euryale.AAC.3
MHEAVEVGLKGSHCPPGCPPRMCPGWIWAYRRKWEDGLARRQPWGRASAVLGPHVPAGCMYCVEGRHASRSPHVHVDGGGGPAKQPKVLPRNGGAQSA